MAAFANATVRDASEYPNEGRGAVSSWSSGRLWTRSEEGALIEAASTQTVPEIARNLGRSEASVRLKLKSLGYSQSDLAGFKVKELSAMLDVSIRQVRRWRQKGYLEGRSGRITEESFIKFCRVHAEKIPYAQLGWDAKVWLRSFGYRPPAPASTLPEVRNERATV